MTYRTILLVRHGEPELPDEKPLYGMTDLPLSKNGMAQAEAISLLIHQFNIDRVISSPLRRCVETAQICHFNPTIVYDFREIDLGSWEMKTKKELQRDFPCQFKERGKNLFKYKTPGGESFHQVSLRANRALQDLMKSPGDIAIYSHSGVFKTILKAILGWTFKEAFSIRQDYCGIHLLIERNCQIQVERLNITPENNMTRRI